MSIKLKRKGVVMAYVIGCLMAGLSFLLNKLLVKYIGIQVVISYSPVLEELTKTLGAYYFEADIVATHIVFGILEAVYDWMHQNNKESGKIAALLSIVGHALFGGLTMVVLSVSGSIFLGIVVGICTHLIWNITLIRLSN